MAESSLKNRALFSEYDSDAEEEQEQGEMGLKGIALERLNFKEKNQKKKLLVMTLGGLLCHRIHRSKRSEFPTGRLPDASYGSFLVYRRPYCEEFLKFCFEKFEVGIWSSAREWYMNYAMNSIMKGLKGKLLFSWKQEDCFKTDFMDLQNKNKPIFLKELKKLWGEKGAKVLGLSFEFSSANTLYIGTEPYKSLLNPPHTGIFLSDYDANNYGDEVLGPGSELRQYLEKLAEAEDVPSFVEKNPFGLPAISPQHPHWCFYSKIIHKYQN